MKAIDAANKPALTGAVKTAAQRAAQGAQKGAKKGAVKGVSEDSAEYHLLWERPGFLLRRLNQIHYALFFECCQEFSITPVQYGLLSALAQSIEPLDQTALCAEVGIDRTTVADVTRRLSKRGLLQQNRSPLDGRQKMTQITESGRVLTGAMHESMRRAQESLLAPLPEKEKQTFLRTLVKLVSAHNDRGHTPVKAFE